MVPFSQTVLRVDVSCDLHPFFVHKLDAGSIWLATLAHAFNYRVAVLRDGVKSALRVGRSRKVEGQILTDTDISWGHHVHDLALRPRECLPVEDASIHTEESGAWDGRDRCHCISYARRLWPPAPGCLCALEDGLVGVL